MDFTTSQKLISRTVMSGFPKETGEKRGTSRFGDFTVREVKPKSAVFGVNLHDFTTSRLHTPKGGHYGVKSPQGIDAATWSSPRGTSSLTGEMK